MLNLSVFVAGLCAGVLMLMVIIALIVLVHNWQQFRKWVRSYGPDILFNILWYPIAIPILFVIWCCFNVRVYVSRKVGRIYNLMKASLYDDPLPPANINAIQVKNKRRKKIGKCDNCGGKTGNLVERGTERLCVRCAIRTGVISAGVYMVTNGEAVYTR